MLSYEHSPNYHEVERYLDFLYGDIEGFVRVAQKQPRAYSFDDYFWKWPEQRLNVASYIFQFWPRKEIYICPSLYSSPTGSKENILGSKVVWAEFDGNSPELFTDLQPSLIVQSSLSTHTHCYWLLDEFLPGSEIELINKRLTYHLEADPSGWDCTQLLRPVETFNHKRDEPVKVRAYTDLVYSADFADELPDLPPAPAVEDISPASLPVVLEQYTLPKGVSTLFENGPSNGDRSNGLMSLGYSCAELGMSPEETLAILLEADEKWGKFARRLDRLQRLAELIRVAYAKYPTIEVEEPLELEPSIFGQPIGLITLTEEQVEIDWALKDLLVRRGMMILSGSPGVGKSQLGLNFAIRAATGGQWLNWQFTDRFKVGFLSLEMEQSELSPTVGKMTKALTLDSAINKGVLIWPLGFSVDMSRTSVQKEVRALVQDYELDCLVIDSLSAASSESLQDEQIRMTLGFIKRLQTEFDIFTLILHHDRKTAAGEKKKSGIDEVYGSTFIGATASTVGTVLGKSTDTVELVFSKVRMSAVPKNSLWKRDNNLLYLPIGTSSHKSVTPQLSLETPPGVPNLDFNH